MPWFLPSLRQDIGGLVRSLWRLWIWACRGKLHRTVCWGLSRRLRRYGQAGRYLLGKEEQWGHAGAWWISAQEEQSVFLADLFPFLAGIYLKAPTIRDDEMDPAGIVLARIPVIGESARGPWIYTGVGLPGGMKNAVCQGGGRREQRKGHKKCFGIKAAHSFS
ncbi:hypothetical protein GCM10007866_25440 [Gluconobacter albidus]|uniref:Uncharacterized protein n=1 Tax=Gluconobacter albidus TaxID=318683 RepID=A0ABQ5X2P5_9PROT|nr:hypothetical protein AA3250_1297 [Gluconobacter albidus NBRC 3250]GLQ70091.1 hypothetical protein GCM10007866_25440 [Gluconobacter albidus]